MWEEIFVCNYVCIRLYVCAYVYVPCICIHHLLLCWYITNHLKAAYNNKHLSHTVAVNWESEKGLAGYFWLRVSHEITVRMSGLYSSEDLTRAGRSASNLAHSRSFWQEASVPCQDSLSIRLLECPHNTAVGFLQKEWLKREGTGRSHHVFITQPRKSDTIISVPFYWPHRPILIRCGRRLHNGTNNRN